MKILFFLSFFSTIFLIKGSKPVVVAAVSQAYINYLTSQAIDFINKNITVIHIPDTSGKILGAIHYAITNFYFNPNKISPSQIQINLINGQPEIQFDINNLGGYGNFDLEWKVTFITEHDQGTIGLQGESATVNLHMSVDGNERPQVQVDGNIDLRDKDLTLHFRKLVDKVIIDALFDIFKDELFFFIRHFFDLGMKMIDKDINKKLSNISLDHNITNNFWIHYSFPYAPIVVNDHISADLYAYIYPKNHPSPPPFNPPDLPKYDPSNNKGFQLFLSDFLIQTGLDSAFVNNFLEYHFNLTLLGIFIEFDCSATKSPKITFLSNLFFNASLLCNVTAKNSQIEQKFGVSSDLLFDMSEVIRNAQIFFRIDESNIGLKNLKFINPQGFDLKWFENNIDFIVEVIATVANDFFGQNGLPLPKFSKISYSDLEQYIRSDYISVYMTPRFNISIS